jgi:hypothetical protein
MAEYTECITKHRAKHFVCEFCNEHCGDDPCEPSDCEWMAAIESEPAADVVEVVRCKDCKHGRIFGLKKQLVDCPYYDDHMVDFDHFCSYGERRSDNATD